MEPKNHATDPNYFPGVAEPDGEGAPTLEEQLREWVSYTIGRARFLEEDNRRGVPVDMTRRRVKAGCFRSLATEVSRILDEAEPKTE